LDQIKQLNSKLLRPICPPEEVYPRGVKGSARGSKGREIAAKARKGNKNRTQSYQNKIWNIRTHLKSEIRKIFTKNIHVHEIFEWRFWEPPLYRWLTGGAPRIHAGGGNLDVDQCKIQNVIRRLPHSRPVDPVEPLGADAPRGSTGTTGLSCGNQYFSSAYEMGHGSRLRIFPPLTWSLQNASGPSKISDPGQAMHLRAPRKRIGNAESMSLPKNSEALVNS
jgi:hypothetical protein